MSVSVAETDGKSFENPAYEAGERPAGPTTGAAAAAPDVSDKVGRPKSPLACRVTILLRPTLLHGGCIYTTRCMYFSPKLALILSSSVFSFVSSFLKLDIYN